MDLITVGNLLRYQRRPAHLFITGSFFLAMLGLVAIAAGLFLPGDSESTSFGEVILVIFGTGSVVSSLMLAGFAFLAELTIFGRRPEAPEVATTWFAAKSGTPPDEPQGSEHVH